MDRLTDAHVWLQSLIYWLLLAWYGLVIFAIIAIIATWSARPLTSFAQVPWWSFVLAASVMAGTYRTVSDYLSQSVHHLVYGQHDDAYDVVERMNQELQAQAGSDTLLPTLVATLADTLKLPYVSIQLGQDNSTSANTRLSLSTTYGHVPDQAEVVTLPLRYHDLTLGTLQISARRRLARLSLADLRLINMLVRQVGITLYATQLTDALLDSRAQLVAAREEERRRIRRDLHDGLGPTLASFHLQLSALRHSVRDNPDVTQRINELRNDVRAATAEVRRLVYDLRPPMLDEFGLLGALRNLDVTSNGLECNIEASAVLPPLPAAVEVAAYRIVTEALHNITRHAQATRCTIRFVLHDDYLTFSVTDNGCGLPETYLPGVGHLSMQERAQELGGTVTISPAPEHGTCVTASFPLKVIRDV